ERPVALSRTRVLGRDRAGLPGEPGRGFFQDVALLAQDSVLTTEPAELLALVGGQTVLAVAVVASSLCDPVADRLRGRLELLREFLGLTAGPDEFDHAAAELRRVWRMGFRHRGLLFPRKGSGVHETGGTSDTPTAAVQATATPAADAWRRAGTRTASWDSSGASDRRSRGGGQAGAA